jgi:alkanesulfonate monooxygenase SsuD/methylene tetrahydromethanopterin reductase-like flavin-dependent oxidoreductase (luciferase family)
MAGTVSELTGGRFVLGIGAGGTRNAAYRRTVGLPRVSPLELVRDYLVAVRGLLSGATVTHVGCTFAIDGAKLHFKPPFVPLYVAALGPQMLRLAGVAADGVMLSWTSPTQNAWTRARVAEGANQAGRDPSTVSFVGYVRMCIDEDVALARDAVSRQFQMYEGLGSGYDQHFQRMFGKEAMAKLVAARNAGLSEEERAKTIPDEMLRQVAYFGPAAGAPAAFRRLSVGMDVALVRVIIARPEGDHASQVVNSLRACSPLLAGASLPPD